MNTNTFEEIVLKLVDGMVAGAEGVALYDIHASLERVADEVRVRAELEETPVEQPKWDERHGGPYDRGGADSYYRRPFNPHYYVGGTGQSDEVTKADMTEHEIAAYTAGFEDNEEAGNFKDY